MKYHVDITDIAKKDILRLQRSEPIAFKKILKLIDELHEHPTTGTGHPEPLSADKSGQWSRRITEKHRLIYQINETNVIVLVLSAYGHYNDK
jgi:toxin YoeB